MVLKQNLTYFVMLLQCYIPPENIYSIVKCEVNPSHYDAHTRKPVEELVSIDVKLQFFKLILILLTIGCYNFQFSSFKTAHVS